MAAAARRKLWRRGTGLNFRLKSLIWRQIWKQNKEEVCSDCYDNRRGVIENKWEMLHHSTRFDFFFFPYGQTGAFAELFVLAEANK